MATYRIHPSGVQTVLNATLQEAEEFSTLVKPLSGSVEAAAAGAGNSGAIVGALNEFFTAQDRRMKGMASLMSSCLNGAAEATKAYNRGDLEMMATYQSNAVNAAHHPTR
jgi:hypothetical protein